MMNIDITNFSVSELDELISRAYTEKQKRKEKEVTKLENELKNILDKIKEMGFQIYLDCNCCGEENYIESDNVRIEW